MWRTVPRSARLDLGVHPSAGPQVVGLRFTDASVAWSPPPWPTRGDAAVDQRTPSLVGVVQEVVSRPGWVPGNAVAIIVSGSGERGAAAFENDPDVAPVLHVEYTGVGTPANQAPVAVAHATAATWPEPIAVTGTATAIGCPAPPVV